MSIPEALLYGMAAGMSVVCVYLYVKLKNDL